MVQLQAAQEECRELHSLYCNVLLVEVEFIPVPEFVILFSLKNDPTPLFNLLAHITIYSAFYDEFIEVKSIHLLVLVHIEWYHLYHVQHNMLVKAKVDIVLCAPKKFASIIK